MNKRITSTCSCCGKPLEDPISVQFGIGPVCRVAKKLKEMSERSGNLFANRAEYDYGIQGEVIWIVDNGGLKSVTNDMENILADIIREEEIDLCRYKIMYQDSMGIWDGVRIGSSGSVTFFPIGEVKQHHAKNKLLEMTF
ncbi:MAG TPA: DUF6011 domain-containing protein [Prolixibacteraceae bacterium]|nr:DUF6011 domain-containing protein [Prolixibacteraceae bacterium]